MQDAPQSIPDLVDLLVVGGGPAGTAAAFRAKELGINALLIDFDDILKRIRDYPKDKQILPDFGGGDRMSFPDGGNCVRALQFNPIDKDDMCGHWKGLYKTHGVPVITGIELTGATRDGDVLNVNVWHHKQREEGIIRARHVVLAIGRGVPRRLDLSGNVEGIMYRMDDPVKYATEPVLVIGGGTSAAEAVLAISEAKIAADDPCPVYWSFRGTKMPAVSKALAERFFEAYVGNGNIRSLPNSEPVAVVTGPDRVERISLRVDRTVADGRPPETRHLEFSKSRCIACIGEDLPEKLLLTLGIHMVPAPGGTSTTMTRKMMAVSTLLETEQKHIYLIGDLLSQQYLEVDDFSAPPETFRQVKHRGNIKTSLRDGVLVAEVVKQRLDGKRQVEVVLKDVGVHSAAPVVKDMRVSDIVGLRGDAGSRSVESQADQAQAPEATRASLVLLSAAGVEVGEFRLKPQGATTLGRTGCDVSFPHDTFLSEAHASISQAGDGFQLRDDGSRTGTYLRVRADRPIPIKTGDLIRAGQQILVVSATDRGMPVLEHYDVHGNEIAVYPLQKTVVFGRSGGASNPDVILDDADTTLSRFHMSIVVDGTNLSAQDFASRNGTYLKVDANRALEHGDVIRVGAQQLEVRLREDLPEKKGSAPVPQPATPVIDAVAAPAPPPAPKGATGPHVTFQKQNKSGALDPSKPILAWADENDVRIDYECWIGMCGCDAIRIISGAEHLNEVTEKEAKTLKRKGLEPGKCRLACMTKASGPVVVDVV